MKPKSTALKKGFQGRDPISHRKSSRKLQAKRFKNTGKMTYRGTKVGKKIVFGLGHKAGENWAEKKVIDPKSRVQKYSKNSPSFDEGVMKYKSAKSRTLQSK